MATPSPTSAPSPIKNLTMSVCRRLPALAESEATVVVAIKRARPGHAWFTSATRFKCLLWPVKPWTRVAPEIRATIIHVSARRERARVSLRRPRA